MFDWAQELSRAVYPESIAVAIVLSSIDIVLTIHICSRLGIDSEKNILFKWALRRGGSRGLVVLWLLFWSLAILFYKDSVGIWLVMATLTAFAVIHNATVVIDDLLQAKGSR